MSTENTNLGPYPNLQSQYGYASFSTPPGEQNFQGSLAPQSSAQQPSGAYPQSNPGGQTLYGGQPPIIGSGNLYYPQQSSVLAGGLWPANAFSAPIFPTYVPATPYPGYNAPQLSPNIAQPVTGPGQPIGYTPHYDAPGHGLVPQYGSWAPPSGGFGSAPFSSANGPSAFATTTPPNQSDADARWFDDFLAGIRSSPFPNSQTPRSPSPTASYGLLAPQSGVLGGSSQIWQTSSPQGGAMSAHGTHQQPLSSPGQQQQPSGTMPGVRTNSPPTNETQITDIAQWLQQVWETPPNGNASPTQTSQTMMPGAAVPQAQPQPTSYGPLTAAQRQRLREDAIGYMSRIPGYFGIHSRTRNRFANPTDPLGILLSLRSGELLTEQEIRQLFMPEHQSARIYNSLNNAIDTYDLKRFGFIADSRGQDNLKNVYGFDVEVAKAASIGGQAAVQAPPATLKGHRYRPY